VTLLDELWIALGLKTEDFQRGMDGAAKKLDGFEKMSTKQLENVGDSFGGLGGKVENLVKIIGGLWLTKKAVGWFKDLSSAAAEEEETMRGLRAELELNGYQWDRVAGKVGAFQKELERTTKYSDDKTAEVLKILLLYTDNLDDAMSRVKTVYGMASTGLMDYTSAARMVGMAMSGNVAMVGKYVPEIRALNKDMGENADKTELASKALGILQGKFEPLAATTLDSVSGKLDQLSNSTDNVKKSLGGLINTALTPAIPVLKRYADEWAAIIESWQKIPEETDLLIKQTQMKIDRLRIRAGKAPLYFKPSEVMPAKELEDMRHQIDTNIDQIRDSLEEPIRPTIPTELQGPPTPLGAPPDWLKERMVKPAAEEVTEATKESVETTDELIARWQHWSDLTQSSVSVLSGGIQEFGSLLVDSAVGADVSWGDFFKNFFKSIAKAIAQALILRGIVSLAGGPTSWLGKALLGGFDNPVNDLLATSEGERFGRMFMDGLNREFGALRDLKTAPLQATSVVQNRLQVHIYEPSRLTRVEFVDREVLPRIRERVTQYGEEL
jgi:hypothetical protein